MFNKNSYSLFTYKLSEYLRRRAEVSHRSVLESERNMERYCRFSFAMLAKFQNFVEFKTDENIKLRGKSKILFIILQGIDNVDAFNFKFKRLD